MHHRSGVVAALAVAFVVLVAAVASSRASDAPAAEVAQPPGVQTVIRIAKSMGAGARVRISCVDLGGPDATETSCTGRPTGARAQSG
jgi:hypothetical protein